MLTTLVNFTGTTGAALGSLPKGALALGGDGSFHGTTTAEAKSGYGLTVVDERRSLEAIHTLASRHTVELVATNLAGHAIPAEFADRRTAYVDLVVHEILPATAGLARFCDVFCDPTAFTPEESRRILLAGRELGLTPRIHADEFEACGGAELAAEVGALQIHRAGGRGAVQEQRLQAECLDVGLQGLYVQRTMHRIARLRMRKLEVELHRGRQADAGAPEADARRRVATQRAPRVRDDRGAGRGLCCGGFLGHRCARGQRSAGNACSKAGGKPRSCRISRAVALGSKMSIRSSQASNSGAGRRPSTRRAYSASWKEVVW